MIPRIAPRGRSFKGAGAYFLHDKESATSERVAWTYTENLRTDDPEKALKIMAWTANHGEALKRDAGASQAGAKAIRPVYHFSLAWHPEQQPEPEHMRGAARSALERLGLVEHQSVMVAHTDTDHLHVHVIVNLVHPETGYVARTGLDKRGLQAWALEYEREHGKIYCPQREENASQRAQGIATKYQEDVRAYTEKVARAYHAADNGKAFAAALEAEGLSLANGRRGAFVIVDEQGDIQKLARQIEGVSAKDIKAKLADLPPGVLPIAEQLARERHQTIESQQAATVEQDQAPLEAVAQLQPEPSVSAPAEVEPETPDQAAERELSRQRQEIEDHYRLEALRKGQRQAEETVASQSGFWARLLGRHRAALAALAVAQSELQRAEEQQAQALRALEMKVPQPDPMTAEAAPPTQEPTDELRLLLDAQLRSAEREVTAQDAFSRAAEQEELLCTLRGEWDQAAHTDHDPGQDASPPGPDKDRGIEYD